ncbi:multidrug ABC transporter permease [Lysinibacillus sp. 2017]|uniref:ABC transporter permease n=1 Tax=unclassified Lysinibacillus TaxID=2636778 RepID=UPI000D527A7F|nr:MULTISPECIES: ABC transporter permease [unclassified Lysinibacillus]AWE07140.1 multidrug ABC transporter permease [Lysinibacillus sp. 2017]TGN36940.1 ABC transporter permease [Lysinibacillus sp. S2017]
MLWSLVSRNNKVFLRDKVLVFFSLLSVLILIGVYVIFLQKLQVSSIEQYVPISPAIEVMVSEWMVAGLLSIIAMTTTLATFGIYIKDIESKITADFLVTDASRFKIQLSYVISSFIIGFIMTFIGFICCEIFIVSIGGEFLSIIALMKVIGILILAVMMSSMINLFIVLFVNTETAFSTVNTIIGTVLGFLCGIYVPMSALPNYVQSIIHFFPVSHITVLLRNTFMTDSFDKVFGGNVEFAEDYMLNFGVVYKINGSIISGTTSILFIVGTIILLGFLSAIVFLKKHK